MVRFFLYPAIALVGFAAVAQAQSPVVRLKSRTIGAETAFILADETAAYPPGHWILQFPTQPTADLSTQLAAQGIRVLGAVPDQALLVSASAPFAPSSVGAQFAMALSPSDKLSPTLDGGPSIVELHPDANIGLARLHLLGMGADLAESPDLSPLHLLVRRLPDLQQAAALDEVAYIFPASSELAVGLPTLPCGGPLTIFGRTAQLVATNGPGWKTTGSGPVPVGYVFSQMTSRLDAAQTQAEITRAMAEWAKVVKVQWIPGTDASAAQTVNILFGSYSHGDAYPFDGPGGVLAHTFYPSPPNPEPIAGDMHFDDSETWRIGATTDVFSVALHELGHALGLGHSDSTSDVMYPYYRQVSTLADGDKAAILTMYAAQDATPTPSPTPTPTPTPTPIPTPTPAPTPTPTPSPTPTPTPTPAPTPPSGGTAAPPSLDLTSPGSTTISTMLATLSIAGTASSSIGVARVQWSTATGSSGAAQGTTSWSAQIPLYVGVNTITIQAFDTAGNSSWRSVVAMRH